jgi:serine/threonine protein kinase
LIRRFVIAVEKLHEQGIRHPDLGLNNVFRLANGSIRIIDFDGVLQLPEGKSVSKMEAEYAYAGAASGLQRLMTLNNPKAEHFRLYETWEMLSRHYGARSLLAREPPPSPKKKKTSSDNVFRNFTRFY